MGKRRKSYGEKVLIEKELKALIGKNKNCIYISAYLLHTPGTKKERGERGQEGRKAVQNPRNLNNYTRNLLPPRWRGGCGVGEMCACSGVGEVCV